MHEKPFIHADGPSLMRLAIGVLCAVIALAYGLSAYGQDAPVEPPPATKYTSTFGVEFELTPAQLIKLEAKAISIIRRKGAVSGEQATLAEARAITRPNGIIDAQVCWEYVSTDRLRGIVQATVTGVRIQRPEPLSRAP